LLDKWDFIIAFQNNGTTTRNRHLSEGTSGRGKYDTGDIDMCFSERRSSGRRSSGRRSSERRSSERRSSEWRSSERRSSGQR